MAPLAKLRRLPSPGDPSPDHPVRWTSGVVVPSPGEGVSEVGRPSVCGTPRIVKLLARSPKPFVLWRMRPTPRISAGFSKFSARAGRNSATKRGSLSGRVAMYSGSMVKLFWAGWQVPQVLPFPLKVSLKNRSAP